MTSFYRTGIPDQAGYLRQRIPIDFPIQILLKVMTQGPCEMLYDSPYEPYKTSHVEKMTIGLAITPVTSFMRRVDW